MNLLLAFWLLQKPAAAEPFPACVTKTSESTYREPNSLRDLVDCQKKKLERFVSNYERQHGDLPSDATVARWEELQRREVQDFITRRPNVSVLEREHPKAAQSPKPGSRSRRRPKKTGAQDPGSLRRSLWSKSAGGRKGITPQMAAEIINHITDQQGFVSPDMTDLLEAVQKDGASLTEGTVDKLKGAARKAEGAGLDLGVKPDIKDFLLKEEAEQSAPPKVD